MIVVSIVLHVRISAAQGTLTLITVLAALLCEAALLCGWAALAAVQLALPAAAVFGASLFPSINACAQHARDGRRDE